MSRRAVLWVAFAVVHVGIAVLGWVLPNHPMGDVYLVYEPWANWSTSGVAIVGITEPFVYPQLALLPMVLAEGLSWIFDYQVGWAVLVTALDALGFAMLVGRGHSTGRSVGAWFWLSYLALLGPIAMYRIDAITVPIAVAGCLWLVGRPGFGSALLAIAMWIKVWPAALLLAAVIAVRRRIAIVGGAVAVTVAVIVVVVAAGGGAHLFGFIDEQTDRGLQIEAPVSTFYLWRAVAGIPGSFMFYNQDLLTFQVTGPEVDTVIALMTPLLALAVAGLAALGAVKAWRGATFLRLFPPLALAIVLALIAFNKVGSPQFLTWLIAPIVIGLVIDRHRWWRLATLALVLAALTQLVYPLLYALLIAFPHPNGWAVLVLSLRNLGTVVLFVWAVVRLASVPTAGGRASAGLRRRPSAELASTPD